MSEMSTGIRSLEMHERQEWHRARAQREHVGQSVDSTGRGPRLRVFRRTGRAA